MVRKILLAVSAIRVKIIFTKRCKIALHANLFISLKIFTRAFESIALASSSILIRLNKTPDEAIAILAKARVKNFKLNK